MKLSTELLLTNLVILVALWYCAFNDMLYTTCSLLVVMFVIRFASVAAARRERAAETERIKAIIAKVKAKRAEKIQ